MDYINEASKIHGMQMYGTEPYSFHLKQVVDVLREAGCKDETLFKAAAFHDTLEDCNVSFNDIAKIIGYDAADIVYDLTNELGKNRKERAAKTYPKIANNSDAIAVKLADRIANIRYSQKTGSSMLNAYMKEDPIFRYFLYKDYQSELISKLWRLYDQSLGDV